MNAEEISAEIAVAAARLVVDEGMEYAAAKHKAGKAARAYGPRARLPSNEELEDAVREHIDIFCADTQPGELQALRDVALLWMQRLADYRPHLSGAAWRGTATRLSAVHVDLYCDDPKGTEIELINAGVDYDVGHIERAGAEPVNVLTVGTRSAALGELVSVHLILRDADDLRGALKPDARGRSWRGDTAALALLMQAEPP